MITKYSTPCCALCQITGENNDSFESIRDMVFSIQDESFDDYPVGTPNYKGQRSIFTIVSPGEDIYEANLKKLKFKKVAKNLNRRCGYPPGKLDMYLLSW